MYSLQARIFQLATLDYSNQCKFVIPLEHQTPFILLNIPNQESVFQLLESHSEFTSFIAWKLSGVPIVKLNWKHRSCPINFISQGSLKKRAFLQLCASTLKKEPFARYNINSIFSLAYGSIEKLVAKIVCFLLRQRQSLDDETNMFYWKCLVCKGKRTLRQDSDASF